MAEPLPPLNIKKILQQTGCERIHYFDSIDSTNSFLMEKGQCGDICISDSQRAGRGRRGNQWVSPASGNLYFSIDWCFDCVSEHWSLLSLIVGIATCEALSGLGLTAHGIKWPNDIYWNRKKLGGILLETCDQSGEVVIGIGLNISIPASAKDSIDQACTSLEEALSDYSQGESLNGVREQLVIALIKSLYLHLDKFKQFCFSDFSQSWQEWDILQNEQVSFEHQNECVSGRVAGIDKQGQLGIVNAAGQLAFFSTADIRLKKLVDK